MKIEIVEPEGEYTPPEMNGNVLVMCDCSYLEPCPQGPKIGSAPRCQIWIRKDSVTPDKYATIRR